MESSVEVSAVISMAQYRVRGYSVKVRWMSCMPLHETFTGGITVVT